MDTGMRLIRDTEYEALRDSEGDFWKGLESWTANIGTFNISVYQVPTGDWKSAISSAGHVDNRPVVETREAAYLAALERIKVYFVGALAVVDGEIEALTAAERNR
jgi:hypothetical protein